MNSEIICVGTELLMGDVINTNASWIAKELSILGVNCYYHTVVGDNPERLKNMVIQALKRSDLIILTGGLGPTYDDLTKEIVADAMELSIHFDPAIYKDIETYFETMGRVATKNNERQAYIPKGAQVLKNYNGTAPGVLIEKEGKVVILLPGPPHELKAMFQESVYPYLLKKRKTQLVSKRIYLFGIGEAAVESLLEEKMRALTNPTIAPYAGEEGLHLRITAGAATVEEAQVLLKPVVDEVVDLLKDYIIGIDIESFEHVVLNSLKEKGLTIGVAESCTGGLLSERLTKVSGSSSVFKLGISAYDNAIKESVLGVDPKTLTKFGAVSEQVCIEMVKGIKNLSNTDIAVAITGIAGPTGGTVDKPVGTVYIAVLYNDKVTCQLFHLNRETRDSRLRIRKAATSHALKMIVEVIREG